MKENNSKGVYKLSSDTFEDEVTSSYNNIMQLYVGHDKDDWHDVLTGDPVEGRLQLGIETPDYFIELDLQELLTEIRKRTPHLF